MKFFLCLAAIMATSAMAHDFDSMFDQYKRAYKKSYTKDSAEHAVRKGHYVRHFQDMEVHNKRFDSGEETWYKAINQFSDMSKQEFQDKMLDRKGFLAKKKNTLRRSAADDFDAPAAATVDWRSKGAVTAVKNQGQCGSCWTFSATGSIEGANFLATKKLTSFSEQEIVSCCHVNGAQGCGGGIMDSAFEYVVTKGGLSTEAVYPYTSGGGNSGSCKKKAIVKGVISGHKDVSTGSSSAMTTAITSRPVSIAVDASDGWQTYGGGTLSNHCGSQLDHGVLAVGYTKDYWIVKNSWATTWGEDGYIYLSRKGCNGGNQCGLLNDPSYPTTTKALSAYADLPDVSGARTTMTVSAAFLKGSTHYGNPTAGCMSGEEAVQIQGVTGDFCSPSCASGPCPTDVPTGTTAMPECALETQGSSKPSRCALICESSSKCPTGASCQMVQGTIGLCTYAA